MIYYIRELVIRDVNSKVDPYAVISYKGKDLTTPVLRKTRFPHWNKTYEMPINRPLEDPDNRTVRITIFDSKFHQDAFLGEVSYKIYFWQLMNVSTTVLTLIIVVYIGCYIFGQFCSFCVYNLIPQVCIIFMETS